MEVSQFNYENLTIETMKRTFLGSNFPEYEAFTLILGEKAANQGLYNLWRQVNLIIDLT